jgi:hypothetical protein
MLAFLFETHNNRIILQLLALQRLLDGQPTQQTP